MFSLFQFLNIFNQPQSHASIKSSSMISISTRLPAITMRKEQPTIPSMLFNLYSRMGFKNRRTPIEDPKQAKDYEYFYLVAYDK